MRSSEFQRFSIRSSELCPAAGVQRKRRSTRLLQLTHTARLSRRLLSTAKPGSRRASHAVCLRLWQLGRFRIHHAQRQQSMRAFQDSSCRASRHRDRFGLSSAMRSLIATSSASDARTFTSQPSPFGGVAESLFQSEMTPNHALQRTAPRVTLAATHHPAAFAHPAPAMSPQPARRAPQSLSLGSLGH